MQDLIQNQGQKPMYTEKAKIDFVTKNAELTIKIRGEVCADDGYKLMSLIKQIRALVGEFCGCIEDIQEPPNKYRTPFEALYPDHYPEQDEEGE